MNDAWEINDINTRIHWAAEDGNVETMQNMYENAELYEAEHGDRPRWLGPHTVTVTARPPVNREAGWTPLHVAARFGRVAFVEALLARGAEVSPVTEKGRTPLAVAAIYGGAKLAQVLIDSGANVNLADHEGRTPFDFASDDRHTDVLRVLINAGVSVRDLERERHPRRDWKGWCARAINAYCGPAPARTAPPPNWGVQLQDSLEEHLRLLLGEGADPDYRCPQGTGTALHVAVRCNIVRAATVLIEHKASVNRGHWDMPNILLDAGALSANAPEQARAQAPNTAETERENRNVADNEGWFPIHRAVLPGWPGSRLSATRCRRVEPSVEFIKSVLLRGPLITLAQNVVAADERRTQRPWEENLRVARQTLAADFDSSLARIFTGLDEDSAVIINDRLRRLVAARIRSRNAAAAAPPAAESDAQEGNSNEDSVHEQEEEAGHDGRLA